VAASAPSLRPYRPADLETLYRIDQACFPKGIAYGHTEMRIYLHSPGAHCLLAEVVGEAAGFILTERSRRAAHIITLDVLEHYRRQKIGSLLLAAAEQESASHGVARMVLETATTNHAAIAFWHQHGYREFGVVKDYYGRGLDTFEMEKRLVPMPRIRPE
jgi:[ribosomal protein S18]-alanine N-acetyltransferase